MSRWVLHHQTLVALYSLEDGRLLNRPFSDISPFLGSFGVVLLCVRRLPSSLPVVCELLKEGSFELCGLVFELAVGSGASAFLLDWQELTVKVGFSRIEVVVASSIVVEEESTSSASSALTLPRRSAEE